MSKERFNAQRFLELAGDEQIINLDVTLKQLASSRAFGYFNEVADDGDIIFCPQIIFWKGPIPHQGELTENFELANNLRESLKLSNEVLGKIGELEH